MHSEIVYGLWGFETLAQLIERNDVSNTFVISRVPLVIVDAPPVFCGMGSCLKRHSTSSLSTTFECTINSLTSLKLNVLHLHPTDSQSFPTVLDSVKNQTHAAYGLKAVCTKEDLRKLSEFGKRRRVLAVPR